MVSKLTSKSTAGRKVTQMNKQSNILSHLLQLVYLACVFYLNIDLKSPNCISPIRKI